MKFVIEKDFNTQPYEEVTLINGKWCNPQIVNTLQFYSVKLENFDQSFIFEIRDDDGQITILEHEDINSIEDNSLNGYLLKKGLNLDEINKIVDEISLAIHSDYYIE